MIEGEFRALGAMPIRTVIPKRKGLRFAYAMPLGVRFLLGGVAGFGVLVFGGMTLALIVLICVGVASVL